MIKTHRFYWKKKYTIILCLLLMITGAGAFAQVKVVEDISSLAALNEPVQAVIVKDKSAGGTFVHEDSAVADMGTVLPCKTGGYWVRQFNRADGVNPCWWGAKGDGKHDDLPAIKNATAYCMVNGTILRFPSGIFRITSPWVIGGKTVSEKQLFAGRFFKAATFSMKEHQAARMATPLMISGAAKTCIYGDFDADTLTAIVYYNVRAIGTASVTSAHLFTHRISNIGIYGRYCFNGKELQVPHKINTDNKQIGLVMLFGTNAMVEHCSFVGMQYGMVCNSIYFTSITDCNFEFCSTGIRTNDFNANLLQNISGSQCSVLLDISGSQLQINNLNAEFCARTVWFREGGNSIINGLYCENPLLSSPDQYQVFIGDDKATSNKDKAGVSGVMINMFTVTSGERAVMYLCAGTRQISINGGSIYGNIIAASRHAIPLLSNTNGTCEIICNEK